MVLILSKLAICSLNLSVSVSLLNCQSNLLCLTFSTGTIQKHQVHMCEFFTMYIHTPLQCLITTETGNNNTFKIMWNADLDPVLLLWLSLKIVNHHNKNKSYFQNVLNCCFLFLIHLLKGFKNISFTILEVKLL